jgi:hypothetical protein
MTYRTNPRRAHAATLDGATTHKRLRTGETSVRTRIPFAIGALIATAAVSPRTFAAVTENFDGVTPPALPAGWTSLVNSGAASDIPWRSKAAGYASSPPNAVWVNDVNDAADIGLTSPTFAIAASGSPTVSFKQSYTLWAPDASALANGVFNGGVLEISINGGAFAEFTSAGGAFSAGGYNVVLDPGFDNPLAPAAPLNRSVWGGASAGFVTTTGTIPATALGGTVKFRWRIGTEGGGRSFDTYSGWWIDDFQCGCTLVDAIFANGFDP